MTVGSASATLASSCLHLMQAIPLVIKLRRHSMSSFRTACDAHMPFCNMIACLNTGLPVIVTEGDFPGRCLTGVLTVFPED